MSESVSDEKIDEIVMGLLALLEGSKDRPLLYATIKMLETFKRAGKAEPVAKEKIREIAARYVNTRPGIFVSEQIDCVEAAILAGIALYAAGCRQGNVLLLRTEARTDSAPVEAS